MANYLLIGFGSIANKHYKIIKEKDKKSNIFIYKKNKLKITYDKNRTYIFNLEKTLIDKIDYVFILSPSSSHKYYLDIFIKFKHLKIFIEKPLFDSLKNKNSLYKLYSKNSERIFIGYNMRFMKSLNFIKKYIKNKKILGVTVNNLSNLKFWRKKDYSKSVTAVKKLGGGIILELSHEIDYISYLFNDLKILYKSFDKKSSLKINVEDQIMTFFKSKNFEILLNMNMFSYCNERVIKIFFQNETIVCDLNNGSISFFNKKYIVKKNIIYKNDLTASYHRQFSNFRYGKWESFDRCKIKDGFKVLNLIKEIKQKN